MSQLPAFRELLKQLRESHIEFHKAFRRNGFHRADSPEVKASRNNFFSALDALFNKLSLYDKGFETGDQKSIDVIIAFLEVDIPAFRCGYAKERYYRKLKSLELNPLQKDRLKNIAYALCISTNYRREYRDAVRLMVKLSDQDFVENVGSLIASPNKLVSFKARLMLDVILSNRTDLRTR